MVNGDPVSFTLEAEERLGQVVAGVQQWLGGQGCFLHALAADGEELSAATRQRWSERPVASVEKLEVSARSLGDLHLAIAEQLERLRPMAARLAEVPLQLSTGRDREAMAAVCGLSDAMGALLPLVALLPREAAREELFRDLNAVLRDLVAALEARDTVLTGDLAEYEVAPRLEGLVALLERQP